MKNIEILFFNGSTYTIKMLNTPISRSLIKMLKHLSNVQLEFHNHDNPYRYRIDIIHEQLKTTSDQLGIEVNFNNLSDQMYLNHLHSIYEKNYNGNSIWLQFHESIHMMEVLNKGLYLSPRRGPRADIGYKEKGGLLKRKYTYEELTTCQTTFSAGDVYVTFLELGKTPYEYWADSEPDNIDRLCELAKPMLQLLFKLSVALKDVDTVPKDMNRFDQWFSKYKTQWCKHWGIPDWSTEQITGGILVGSVVGIQDFDMELQTGNVPYKLGLVDADI
jgi:hypothetical protein